MAGITSRIDDALSAISKMFKGKKQAGEVTVPGQVGTQCKAVELGQLFGFVSEDQVGMLLTARDIARTLGNPAVMGDSPEAINSALHQLHDAIENSGVLFGRKNAEKAATALGMALYTNLDSKAKKRFKEAEEYAKKAEELKAGGGNPEQVELYAKKAEAAKQKGEQMHSTAHWYLGVTHEELEANPGMYRKDAEGPKYLQKLVIENKQFLLNMLGSIRGGYYPDLGALLTMSGFLSESPAMSQSIADSLFAVKSALRVEGMVAEMPEKASDLKAFADLKTISIEKVKPGRKQNQPVQEMAEAMRDLLSANLHEFAETNPDDAKYAEIRDDAYLLRNAVWSVVTQHIAQSAAIQDTRVQMMTGVIAKGYLTKPMQVDEAIKVINEMSLKMTTGILEAKLASNDEFKNAKDEKSLEEAVVKAAQGSEVIRKVFAIAANAQLEPKDVIKALVAKKFPVEQKEKEQAQEKGHEAGHKNGKDIAPEVSSLAEEPEVERKKKQGKDEEPLAETLEAATPAAGKKKEGVAKDGPDNVQQVIESLAAIAAKSEAQEVGA